MNSHPREKEIFEACLEVPSEKQKDHLRSLCGHDAALFARVEALLNAHAEARDEPLGPPFIRQAQDSGNATPAQAADQPAITSSAEESESLKPYCSKCQSLIPELATPYCQQCGAHGSGIKLEVDHITPLYQLGPHPEKHPLAFDINNTRVLCIDCHAKLEQQRRREAGRARGKQDPFEGLADKLDWLQDEEDGEDAGRRGGTDEL